MITDTKSIEKTGMTMRVTMNDDVVFKIDTSVEPHTFTDDSGNPVTLTASQAEQAEEICRAMCVIKS